MNLIGVDRWIDASSVMINAIAQDDNLSNHEKAISNVSHLLHDVHDRWLKEIAANSYDI